MLVCWYSCSRLHGGKVSPASEAVVMPVGRQLHDGMNHMWGFEMATRSPSYVCAALLLACS
jgi:hypothetical protein